MSDLVIIALIGAVPPTLIGWLTLREARRAREEAEQAKVHAAEAALKAAQVLRVIPK